MTVMEFLVFCHEHIHGHRQRGKLGGGDSQPHAINAPQGGQQEQRGKLEHQRAQKGDEALVTPSPSAVKKEDAYTLKPMMRKLSAYSRKARFVSASSWTS